MRKPLTDAEHRDLAPRIRELVEIKATDGEIARELGLTVKIVYDIRVKCGIPAAPRHRTAAERAELAAKVADLVKEGVTTKRIGVELGIHRDTVSRLRRDFGIPQPVAVSSTRDDADTCPVCFSPGMELTADGRLLAHQRIDLMADRGPGGLRRCEPCPGGDLPAITQATAARVLALRTAA